MDTKNIFTIRDVRTRNIIGKMDGASIFVPENGQIHNFVSTYNALANYDMGMVAELYDTKAKKVDRFVILYAFKEKTYTLRTATKEYSVLEATLSNLDILELLNQYNEKQKGVVDEL